MPHTQKPTQDPKLSVVRRGFFTPIFGVMLAGLFLVGISPSAIADDYNPIPAGWNIKIGLPGTLSVGAEYCTQSGKCQWVGDDIVGFSIGGTAVGGIQGCQGMPDASPCLKARVPVEVLAASPNGSVIVRLRGKNYAVSGVQWFKREPDGSFIGGPVSVVYQGASIPLQIYLNRGLMQTY